MSTQGGWGSGTITYFGAGRAAMAVDVGPRHPWQLRPFLYDFRLRRVLGDDLDLSIYEGRVPEKVDLLMVDTLHEYGHMMRKPETYVPLLSPSAVVVMDDVHLNGGMVRARTSFL